LASTHDGLIGYWDGSATLSPSALGGFTDIQYMAPSVRRTLVHYDLFKDIRVDYDGERAQVSDDGQRLIALYRPSAEVFQAQLPFLRNYADLRADRMSEILAQTSDILSFFGSICYLGDGRRAWTLELLHAVVALANHVEQRIKHSFALPRPVDFAPQVQPIIQTPSHGTLPSGHATESFAVATVLHRLMTGEGPKAGSLAGAQPFWLAHRIAANRTVAGVHFPVDSAAGAMLGAVLGEQLFGAATGARLPSELPVFKAGLAGAPQADVNFTEQDDFSRDWLGGHAPSDRVAPSEFQIETPLQALWAKAAAEFA
jgi:membrane-associated phospholipid phosphatase